MAIEQIAVVGVGPVGGILATHLIRAGRDVTLIDIYKEHLEKISVDGLIVEGARELTAEAGSWCLSLEEAAEKGMRFDLVYVCVKATAVRFVAPHLAAVLSEGGTAVSFQNGLDTEEGLLAALGPERTLRAAVNYAGNLAGLGRFRMTFFNPPNHLGAAVPGTPAAEQRAREICQLMTAADLETVFAQDVQHHVWEKAILNAGLMPVSALTGQNMAQVMGSDRSLHLVEQLLREEIAIAEAVGHSFGPDFFDNALDYYRKAGTHMPSMRGDVVDERQTEIEFLNHKIAEYGEKHGVACPYNRALANLVLCIDEVAAEKKASQ